jgi:thiol-disulfide isomerase/thioredoxin
MNNFKHWAALTITGLAIGLVTPASSQIGSFSDGVGATVNTDDGVLRKAVGERAERLRKMELTPFAAENWSKLGEWSSGTALGPADIDGKVLLIGSWASWNSTSTRVLPLMDNLAKEHASSGLVVMGLHHDRGWDAGKAMTQRVSFPTAHDTGNTWRTALDITSDPGFYMVDRAGQLRYADIRNESVATAVKLLLAETPEQAAATRDRISQQMEEAERAFRQTRQLERTAATTELPAVPFVMPGADAFKDVKWPVSVELKKDQGGWQQEEPLPQPFTVTGRPSFPASMPSTNGKLIVAYKWNHQMPRGREIIQQLLPEMSALQRRYGRDVVVVGVLTQFVTDNNQQQNQDEDFWNIEKIRPALAEHHRFHNLNHTLVLDDEERSLAAVMMSPNYPNSQQQERIGWPYATIISSDGLTRWAGYIGPLFRSTDELAGHDDFMLALQQMIDRDPGVKARRAAEDAYIRAREGN